MAIYICDMIIYCTTSHQILSGVIRYSQVNGVTFPQSFCLGDLHKVGNVWFVDNLNYKFTTLCAFVSECTSASRGWVFSRQNPFFPGQRIKLDKTPFFRDKTGKDWTKLEKTNFHQIFQLGAQRLSCLFHCFQNLSITQV